MPPYGGSRISIPHRFFLHSYTRPTVCQFCKKLLKGLFKQGVQCRDCQYNAHKKCVEKVPKDCVGDLAAGELLLLLKFSRIFFSSFPFPSLPDNFNHAELNERSVSADRDTKDDDSDTEDGGIGGIGVGAAVNNLLRGVAGMTVDETAEWEGIRAGAGAGKDLHNQDSVASSSANIPLMRIVQSVKHTKRRGDKAIKEGWLVHFTNKEKTVKKHYWRLDSKAITLFVSDQGSKYYKEIPLNEIVAIETARNFQGDDVRHCFEIRTANVDYYVGLDPISADGDDLILPPCNSGVGAYIAKSWETDIRQALMPVTSTSELRVFGVKMGQGLN